MSTQDPFGHLHHDIQAAGLLEGGGATDDGQDGEDDVDRGLPRLQAETEDEDQQADPGDETEGDPTLLRPDDEAGEDDGDLKDDAEGLKGCAGVHGGSPRLGGTGEGALLEQTRSSRYAKLTWWEELRSVSHQQPGTIVLVDTGRFRRASLPAGRELTFWLPVCRRRPSKRTRALFGAI